MVTQIRRVQIRDNTPSWERTRMLTL